MLLNVKVFILLSFYNLFFLVVTNLQMFEKKISQESGVNVSDTRERLKRNTRKIKQPSLYVRLQRKLELFSELLSSEGVHLSPFGSSYAKDHFQRSALGLQRRTLCDLSLYVKLLEDFKSSGGSLRDSRRLTWAFLKLRGLQPCSSTFSRIEEEDVIEVYNSEHIQVFRNIKFFEYYTGSLFDLCVLDWMSLYRRNPQIEEQLFLQLESSFRQNSRVLAFKGVSEHDLSLRFSEVSVDMRLHLKFRSGLRNRLRRSKKIEAVLVTSRLSFLGAGSRSIVGGLS